MGSNIPLPELDLRPLPVPDRNQQMGNLINLQRLGMEQQESDLRQQQTQQQLQMGQIQLNDQQAMSKAMQQWDGKDMNDLPGLLIKNKASANAVMGMRNQILDYQTKLSNLTKDQLQNAGQFNDMIAGHIEAVKAMPAEQQAQGLESAKADLVKRGALSPQEAQQMVYQGPESLDVYEKFHTAHSAQVEQALKASQTREASAKADLDTLTAEYYKNPGGTPLGAPGVPIDAVAVHTYMRDHPGATPFDAQAALAAQKAQAELPAKVATAAAEGTARANTEINAKRQEDSDKQFDTAIGADARLNRMETSYTDAVKNHNQQAMLALLTDHIGMTLGLQKGARITKDILNEAAKSQPWLAGLAAKFDSDGYLSGVNLSPGQMKQMLDLGYTARENAWDTARTTAATFGVKEPPNAAATYNKRKPGDRIYDQGGHTFTLNGQRYENVPDDLYKKYKGQPGFSE